MLKKLILAFLIVLLLTQHSSAQTTNGQIDGSITDPSGAVVPGAAIEVVNQNTGLIRKSASDGIGYFIIPQLPPGTYSISVSKQGFATSVRNNFQLEVNQSAALNFKLMVSSETKTIQVTGATPALNTTSATLSDVVEHSAIVSLPLNGRQFTQLTLLSPGVAPQEEGQQQAFTIALGAGGISPSVNGQSGLENNYTMDGVVNNQLYLNSWALSPPPEALEEFNVQSHITDAQFAVSSGANINVVTRSGTNSFHGAAWEFARNSVLDSQQFPETQRLPYSQNQYGVSFSGPIFKGNTWFSLYWEGFNSAQSLTYLGSTFTPAMASGDFSALLGPQIGTDSLGRPEYTNEIYDPVTSRPDPDNPGEFLRDPFFDNIIPSGRINAAAPIFLKKYYPAPNLNVAPGVLPNISFTGNTSIASDVTGIRVDHRFGNNDTVFGRYNRQMQTETYPEALPSPGFNASLVNSVHSVAIGYTHLFGTNTILSMHYGYSGMDDSYGDGAAGTSMLSAFNLEQAFPVHDNIPLGPDVGISNGYSGVSQSFDPLGPDEGNSYYADLTKVIGKHTIGVGGMLYFLHLFDDGWTYNLNFTQNATSQDGLASSTGMGPASFLLGVPDNYFVVVGNSAADLNVYWYAGYAQDQWQVAKKLSITAGLRYDYVSPPDYHKPITGIDIFTGQFLSSAAVPPLFPSATAPSTWFYPQRNGFEPRFGVVYQVSNRTLLKSAFAILDDHNDTMIAQDQGIRVAWPTAAQTTVTNLDDGLPTVYMNQMPAAATFLNPNMPIDSVSSDPHNKIAYSMQYNAQIQQQLSNSFALNLAYVGSMNRHMFIEPTANTAEIPGPGSLASRGQPFPQYGGPFIFTMTGGSSSYNALQAELKKTLSSSLFIQASYTWSKSLDIESTPYAGTLSNIYNMHADWGPSDFNRSQMLVLSGMYALPVGRGKRYLSTPNRFIQGIAGNWNAGSIISLIAGTPFNIFANGDVANVGGGTQRAEEIGNPYSGPGFHQSPQTWINPASFANPAPYTFGNEHRNDLVGPAYKDLDFNLSKDYPLTDRKKLQFRGEFFNLFNHTNYGIPSYIAGTSSLGQITSTNGAPREIQLALKLLF